MFSKENLVRVRDLNQKPVREEGAFVLYWMSTARRLAWNHSLDYAIHVSKKYQKELLIYEPLKMDYPWSSPRLHRFLLEGMEANAKDAEKLGFVYRAFVETPDNPIQEVLGKIAANASLVVTDDYPCYIVPDLLKGISAKLECKLLAVDSNSILPLSQYGESVSAARILRPRIHRLFPLSWPNVSSSKPEKPYSPKGESWLAKNPDSPLYTVRWYFPGPDTIESICKKTNFLCPEVLPVSEKKGGRSEGLKLLKRFVKHGLGGYAEKRSRPQRPEDSYSSFLSPYLHFGHISQEETVCAALDWNLEGGWNPGVIVPENKNKREGYFHPDENVNSFLDELVTWRDVGFLAFWNEPSFRKDLNSLPDWVRKNLDYHRNDVRPYLYTKEQLENAKTHDPVWNAAQKELVLSGSMQNYLRMLWGKKVIEWTSDYETAFEILEDFNNKYAYDGRDPNSYTGILWCFGLFDRPWFPERNVFGNIRYMSSDSTAKKFKLQEYFDYIRELETGETGLF
ncbi:deoxyribodipyrimidine photolyase [Leptospira gomenensis]|uniref:Deoxyribodipyrimidine photo-lyase n=1 Tax=Leptospira gomenensis TaxID=2484974 RepID=A0A5F1YFU6_9LEPT|nr:deoxyribodipyrimidine photolyase [Leptospira gomenensis]TGK37593.1 deoxyribodipyrimidine photolyase [Leptospira gomenensis]TGK39398.1 deoxyribodipyrimidine photolyase [Leptospira gomenensis]TGK43178.1 deoxyribodipyrimidine photolyase [Leptospira gomenensis]TGK54993.1 deoxyribodipyrimidine photolyase [Leptospira gomenensis]